MKKTLKRGISLTMTALLCLSAPAAGAFAAAEEEPGEVLLTVEETVSAEEDDYDLSNDELFAVYVENVLYPDGGIAAYAAEMGERLTGVNKTIYDILKPEIQKIANGDENGARPSSSTEITIPVNDLKLTKTSWTAAELEGISILGSGSLTEEAQNAIQKEIGIDLYAIQSALLADCPYEMYWYDKTTGVSISYGLSGLKAAGASEITSVSLVSVTVKFAVAKAYAPSNAGSIYVIDTTIPQRVNSAKTKAAAIVAEHAAKSDYEKLVSYRQAICDLVEYNTAAADKDYDGGYGDPWQLIYVFDGDSTTDVVCEGYAKAFQYLCDLSTFSDENIWCYCVTGTMDNSTVGHMWNLVTMEDGKNYLVDVTNCDTGKTGAPNKLFMVGATSGSVSEENNTGSYTFTIRKDTGYSTDITYTYDPSIIEDFGKNYLTVADANYAPDAMAIAQYTVGGRTLTDNQQGLADHNGDGEVTPLDALLAAYGQ